MRVYPLGDELEFCRSVCAALGVIVLGYVLIAIGIVLYLGRNKDKAIYMEPEDEAH